ncbi:MAG: neutral zinc metallopeptidase [Planctomycetes bacterium]|nr:neutral zinc metallopeptidase [Planctomycetota bacterium]
MQWEGREESQNVEDRRGMGRKAGIALGGGGAVILVVAYFLGIDPQKIQQFLGGGNQPAGNQRPLDPKEEKLAKFTKVIFHDTEVVWDKQFKSMNPPKSYLKPTLVLFTDQVDAGACGNADAAVGPFYCPAGHKVYIDLSFYEVLDKQLKAPGEFARAYVIAHEVGHHVQLLLGYSQRVDEVRKQFGPKHPRTNEMSVRLELQADFLAGVWAHHMDKEFKFLESGDVEAAYNAAFRIGDDTLQKEAKGRVTPDSFTHGTSDQRKRWFKEGLRTGNVNQAAELFDKNYRDL